jgi:hypothetical protein
MATIGFIGLGNMGAVAEPGRGAGDQPADLSDPIDRRAIIGGLRFIRWLFPATA